MFHKGECNQRPVSCLLRDLLLLVEIIPEAPDRCVNKVSLSDAPTTRLICSPVVCIVCTYSKFAYFAQCLPMTLLL